MDLSVYEPRRSRLRQSALDPVDALLVTRLVNVRYLTGFTGSNAAVLLLRETALLATDGRYMTQAASQCPDMECIEARAIAVALVERAVELGVRRLGIEAGHVTIAQQAMLLQAAGDRVELVAVGPLVEALRAVKDRAELGALRRACAITSEAFADVVGRLRAGVTERDVSWWLERSMRERGAQAPAFDSIVAFGPHSAIPHHEPTDRVLATGDLVKIDFGACYDGYHADMTRTVVMGPAVAWQRDLHALVASIQQTSLERARVGAMPGELDREARHAIETGGHRAAHGLGHGVGLEIHEDPFLTPSSVAGALVADVVITIEPGIYLPEQGGVRIEDTIVVGPSDPTVLTTTPRELIEIV